VLSNLDGYALRADPEVAYRQAAWLCAVVWVTGMFAAYFGIHAILSSNPFELLTFFVTALALIIRNLVGLEECRVDESAGMTVGASVACYTLMGASGTVCLACMLLVRAMFVDLSWAKYKAIGAEKLTRLMYRRYEVFCAVQKLDLQFSVITLLTGLIFFTFGGVTAHVATGINVALFVVELVWERAGAAAVHNQDRNAMYLFWGLSVFLPAFIINVAVQWESLLQFAAANSGASSGAIWGTIVAFAFAAIANRAVTVYLSVVLYMCFGENYRGLARILADGGTMVRFDAVRRPGGKLPRRREDSVLLNPMAAAALATAVSPGGASDVVEVLGDEPDLPPTAGPADYLAAIDGYIRRESTAAGMRLSALPSSLAAAAAEARREDAGDGRGDGGEEGDGGVGTGRGSAVHPAATSTVAAAGVPPVVVVSNPFAAAAAAGAVPPPAPTSADAALTAARVASLPRSNRVAAAMGSVTR